METAKHLSRRHLLLAAMPPMSAGADTGNKKVRSSEQDASTAIMTHMRPQAGRVRPGHIALFVAADDIFQARVLQDCLSILLRQAGWDVLEEAALRQARAALSKASTPTSATALEPPDEASVASAAKAQSYLTVTVVLGRQQHDNNGGERRATAEKAVAVRCSFQMATLYNTTTILEGAIAYEYGKSVYFLGLNRREVFI